MGKANLYCENCEQWYTIEYDYVSDLFGRKCPKCNGDETWFGEIECDRSGEIEMGRGGCSQK